MDTSTQQGKLLGVVGAVLWYFLSTGPAQALILEPPLEISPITLDVEIVTMNLTSASPVLLPLGTGTGAIPNTYQLVNSNVTAMESPTQKSSVSFSQMVTVKPDELIIDSTSVIELFPVFIFTDADGAGTGFDYAADFGGDTVTVEPTTPYSVTSVDQIVISLLDSSQTVNSLPPVEVMQTITPLNVDVNGNGSDDEIGIKFSDFLDDDLMFDATFDPILGIPTDIQVSITAATLTILGEVADSVTDPPFGPFTVSGPASQVMPAPEPATLALLAAGLFGLATVRRRVGKKHSAY